MYNPTQIEITVGGSGRSTFTTGMIDWLEENVGEGNYRIDENIIYGYPYLSLKLWFARESDATLFSLKWL